MQQEYFIEADLESETFLKLSGKSIGWKEQLIKYRHFLLALFGSVILALEITEHALTQEFSLSFFIENSLFLGLLGIVSILVDNLLESIDARTRAVRLLEVKHTLSLQLSSAKDWDALTGAIVHFPSSITSPIYTALFLFDANTDKFILIDEQEHSDGNTDRFQFSQSSTTCETCKNSYHEQQHKLEACKLYEAASNALPRNGYCFSLYNGTELVGVLHLHLNSTDSLDLSQIEILNGVGFEIAIALKSAQQQRQIANLMVAEAAIAERHKIFRDLHDVLGQNLGYLHLKLDQAVTTYDDQGLIKTNDLVKMRDVAEESYELVRGTLAALRSSTTPYLSSLLNERSKLLLKQGNFNYSFQEQGQPRPLPPLVLHNTYYIVKEAINNISQHAAAQNVESILIWGNKDLTIIITDDGKGFNPDHLNLQGHFGLAIMQERAALIHGKLDIQSQIGNGTKLTIWIPIKQ